MKKEEDYGVEKSKFRMDEKERRWGLGEFEGQSEGFMKDLKKKEEIWRI